jgi:threonine dehydratase/serine racemase
VPGTTTVTLEDIRAAAQRIAPFARRTPVMTSRTLDERAGRSLFFKCENLQRIGAFKFRGACNAVMQLDDETAARGVVTHSSGNHAQALAESARIRGIEAHIVMPTTAPAVKRRAVIDYGGIVHPCEPTNEARQRVADEVMAETGGVFIPPFDHPHIIAGQGTAALELIEEVGPLDAIIAPIGGGGLMSGTSIAARGLDASMRIFGAEPSAADDAARSLATGRFQEACPPNTIADGLLTSMGPLTWPIIRAHLETIITMDDDAIIETMRFVWERMKIVVEPSGAVSIAAVLSDEFKALRGLDRVGVIISGGNVDLGRLPFAQS